MRAKVGLPGPREPAPVPFELTDQELIAAQFCRYDIAFTDFGDPCEDAPRLV